MSSPAPEIKILIVDDSVFFRTNITKILEEIPGMQIIGLARNGIDALEKLQSIHPDVILLDFFMPKMDGLQFLKEMMLQRPTPTIIITGADKGEYADLYFEALRLGAFDIITKPRGGDALNLGKIKNQLEERIRFATRISPRVISETASVGAITARVHPVDVQKKHLAVSSKVNRSTDRLLIIGASAGGPKAIFSVVSRLQYVPGVVICVIQHMPEDFTKSLAQRIDGMAEYRSKEAEDGELLQTGWIYVAPGNRHMEIVELEDGYHIEVNQKARVHGVRPSVDVFMKSALKVFDPRKIIGVILSGMGEDGAAGLLLIKEQGGFTLSQDKETAEIWGMPRRAMELGASQYILPVSEIGPKIYSLLNS